MKKVFFIISILGLFIGHANSQLFVGGNFNISSTANKYVDDDGTTNKGNAATSFYIIPKAGYFLNENFAVGAGIGYGLYRSSNRADNEFVTLNSSFNIIPFVRYYFAKVDRFSMFAEGGTQLVFGSDKTRFQNTTTQGDKTFELKLYVNPSVSFDISDNFSLEAVIGSLYFGSTTRKEPDNDKHIKSDIGLRLNLTSINIGAIYKF
jgi:hypothetical protein